MASGKWAMANAIVFHGDALEPLLVARRLGRRFELLGQFLERQPLHQGRHLRTIPSATARSV